LKLVSEMLKQGKLVPLALIADELGVLTRETLIKIADAVGLPAMLYTELTTKKTIIEDLRLKQTGEKPAADTAAATPAKEDLAAATGSPPSNGVNEPVAAETKKEGQP
jgi:hypothetical protein